MEACWEKFLSAHCFGNYMSPSPERLHAYPSGIKARGHQFAV